MKCKECGSEIPDVLSTCSTCGTSVGYPNVREVSKEEEVNALEARYQEALVAAKGNGSFQSLQNFEEKVKHSFAVINVDIDFLHDFVISNKKLYANYNKLVSSEIRKPALLEDDRRRRGVEASLFAGYAKDISYAALSLDGSGVKSYGAFTIVLREIAIKNRATLLENNSFHFVKKHKIQAGEGPPRGYRALWENRHKLATAKLEPRIFSTTSDPEYATILLYSTGNFDTDDFIEIHIYGTFDNNAIDRVKGKSFGGSRAMIARIKSKLIKPGKHG
jgi:hypothetical protein